ncbi:MAG: hemerythrin family protein [Planctomycetes bacterium]|nr:hemerythrin family protein [Planctomycetota bacterium]
MPFMQWSEMLAIDGGAVDEQHRGLFDAVNAFHQAVVQGQAVDAVAGTLDYLKDYGHRHFTDEEAMLEASGYPGLAQHRRQHRQFTDQVESFRTQLLEGGSGLGHSMSQFLGSWLVNHIMVADKAYASFLRGSRGLAALPPAEGTA